MVCLLVGLAAVVMGVDEQDMVVLVEMVVAAVLELAERAVTVVVGHVIVVVGVDDSVMRVLVRDVADDALFGLGLGHVVLLRDAFHRPQTGSRSVRLGVALGCRPVTAALHWLNRRG
jgi:hypothetical protein